MTNKLSPADQVMIAGMELLAAGQEWPAAEAARAERGETVNPSENV